MKNDKIKCIYCNEEQALADVHMTDLGGYMCDHCIEAAISSGDDIAVYY